MAAPIAKPIAVPQGMIVVDRFGKRHHQQTTLGEGDRLAYPPALNLEYGHDRIHMFGGTIPVFEPSRLMSVEANQRRYVDWMIEQDKNEKVLFEAIFYLSQDEQGRKLLSEARARGFKFVFDRRTTEEANANALCDFENKLIPISPNTNPVQLMLTLAHELDHMHVLGKGLTHNTHHTFTSFIKISRALEGAARTREAGIAYAFDQMPAHYYKPYGITEYFAWKLPHMAAAARQALHQGHALNSDDFRRNVFAGFYKETDTLAYYDKNALGIFEARLQELQKITDPAKRKAELGAFMGKDAPSLDEITHAIPYLKGVRDLGDGRYTKLIPHQDIKDRHAALAAAMGVAYDGADVTARVGATFDEPEVIKPGLMSLAAAKLLKWFPARSAKSTGTELLATQRPVLVSAETPKTIVMPSKPELEHKGFGETSIRELAKNIGFMQAYREVPNDVVHFALMAPVHHMNHAGHIRELIGLGLRAPIAAFPQTYITSLSLELRGGAEKKGVQLQPADIAILAHWKMLASKGFDPVGVVKEATDSLPWVKGLAAAVGPVAEAKEPVKQTSYAELSDWVKAQASLRTPERQITPLIASVPRGHGRQ